MKVLFDFAKQGDMRGIVQWADRAEKEKTQYIPFARHLRKLADDFKIRAILELVEDLRNRSA